MNRDRLNMLDDYSHAGLGFKEFVQPFRTLLSPGHLNREAALTELRQNWKPVYNIMLLNVNDLIRSQYFSDVLLTLLLEQNGEESPSNGKDVNQWFSWLWNRPEATSNHFADFLAWIWACVDPRFKHYFQAHYLSKIRLDEIRWGGIQQDGIPPLRKPRFVPGSYKQAAGFLDADDMVFGIMLDGQARAYPRKILGTCLIFLATPLL